MRIARTGWAAVERESYGGAPRKLINRLLRPAPRSAICYAPPKRDEPRAAMRGAFRSDQVRARQGL